MPALPAELCRTDPAEHARVGLAAARRVSGSLHEVVTAMDQAAALGASALPGWSRGHVVSHLARNADGLVNLLTWARTGIEHPMYASNADRDADIEEGAQRLVRVQCEDLCAADDRFQRAAERLSPEDWLATVVNRQGRRVPVSLVPWLRVNEVLVHLTDLDRGVGFDRVVELAGADAGPVLDFVVWTYAERTDVPAVRLVVDLPGGDRREWTVGAGEPRVVRGEAAAALAWLTGRGSRGLALVDDPTGAVPASPAWL